MNSSENRSELARACGTYLLACRAGSVKEVQEDVLCRPGRYKVISDNLHVKEVVVGKGVKRRRYLVCFNPSEAKRLAKHREQVLAEIDKMLASHKDDRATSKWAIELLASPRWGRYLRVGRSGKVVVSQDAIRKAERMDGKWVLITNDDTLSVEDAATGYRNLLVIERCLSDDEDGADPDGPRIPLAASPHRGAREDLRAGPAAPACGGAGGRHALAADRGRPRPPAGDRVPDRFPSILSAQRGPARGPQNPQNAKNSRAQRGPGHHAACRETVGKVKIRGPAGNTPE